jgi:hypothetical protein
MARENLVSLSLSRIRCEEEFENVYPGFWLRPEGVVTRGSDPYLWAAMVAVDGEGMSLGPVDQGLPLVGEVIVQGSNGHPHNLVVSEVHAGDEIAIPADVGSFERLSPNLMLPHPCDPLLPDGSPGAVAIVAALFNHNESDDSDIEDGYDAFLRALRTAVTPLIAGRSAFDLSDPDFSFDEAETEDLEEQVTTAVTDAITESMDWFEKVLVGSFIDVVTGFFKEGYGVAEDLPPVLEQIAGVIAGTVAAVLGGLLDIISGPWSQRPDTPIGFGFQVISIDDMKQMDGVPIEIKIESGVKRGNAEGRHRWIVEGHSVARSPFRRDALTRVGEIRPQLEPTTSDPEPADSDPLAELDHRLHADPALQRWADELREFLPAMRLSAVANEVLGRRRDSVVDGIGRLAANREQPVPASLVEAARTIVSASAAAVPASRHQRLMRLDRTLSQLTDMTFQEALDALAGNPPPPATLLDARKARSRAEASAK